MDFFACVTKVFAVSLLFFVNFSLTIAQPDSIYRLPAGTKILLSMDSGISSKVSAVNDTFTSTVSKPLSVRDSVVLPVGTLAPFSYLATKPNVAFPVSDGVGA